MTITGCATTNSSPKPTSSDPAVEVALMVRLDARPEHADAVARLLTDGRAFVMEEAGTPYWFAVRISPTSFAIFDAFPGDAERTAHLQGKLASALLAQAPTVLATAPVIQPVQIIGNKHAFASASRALSVGLIARMQAKPERAAEVAELLAAGQGIVAGEPGTPVWFGVQIDATSYAIFDAFASEADRQAHLEGKLAQTLVSRAGELLAAAPVIEPVDILASKLP
jgi:quinol monooxygenase YgiN